MGLKGYRLWAMGQLDSNVQRPTVLQHQHGEDLRGHGRQPQAEVVVHRCVALQVEFERQNLKPVFHLIGYRLWV